MAKHNIIKVELKHEKRPLLSEFNAFMYDLEILHDIIVLSSKEEYVGTKINKNNFRRRNGRSIKEKHKIRIVSLQSKSPITANLLIQSGMLVCMIIQTVALIKNNREKSTAGEELEDLKNKMSKDLRELFEKTQEKIENNQIQADSVKIMENKKKYRGEERSRERELGEESNEF